MNVCNGVTDKTVTEAVEITRLEPVIIEVEEDDRIFSHLILFELIYKLDITPEEIIINGEVQETIFESEKQEY
nr:hypothetical protein [Nanoarchaeota archaeon]